MPTTTWPSWPNDNSRDRPAGAADLFTGRVAVIATMHRKEQAIAPLLTQHLGVKPWVPAGFDTDALGTFTRDVPRPADQRTTARLKAVAALEFTGVDLAVASEGSFGPHPQMPFVGCDRELVLLYDKKHDLELVGEAVSVKTNYRSGQVRSLAEALQFAQDVGFPSHGLVVMGVSDRQVPPQSDAIFKGITTESDLSEAIARTLAKSDDSTAHVETDMRALYNPTRMAVIAEATEALIQVIQQRCPTCGCPGFSPVKYFPGLPCSLCGTPTLLPLSALHQCQRCHHEQTRPHPEGKTTASPADCPYCNP